MPYRNKPWLAHYDPHVPPHIDPAKAERTLFDLMESAPPGQTAVITTAVLPLLGRRTARLSYGDLSRQVDALAAGLIDMGLAKGERVALVLPNCAAFLVAFYGVLKAGGVVTAVNPTYPPPKLCEQLIDSNARVVITLSKFYEPVKLVQPDTDVEHVIVANIKTYLHPLARTLFTLFRERKEGHRAAIRPGDWRLADVLARYDGQKPDVTIAPDDVCLFQFTGGTTGTPKAAICTHRALIANTYQCAAWVTPEQAERDHAFLAALPLFHVYGLITVLCFGAAFGAPLVMVPDPRDTEEVMACIDYYRCDAFMGVPAFYNAIINHPKAHEYNLSTADVCISGAAPLDPQTKAGYEALTGSRLLEGFGMSEMPSVTHINPVLGENRLRSIGLPVPDVLCRIVSLEDGVTDMPPGEVGEMLVTGPHMMEGYHNRPGATENAVRIDEEDIPWFYTGDIGYMDPDGYFYIVDRKKDVALIGGFSVYPADVERVIGQFEPVVEVAVAGIPHPDPAKLGQEALKAWVVLAEGQQVAKAEIIAHARRYLAPYAVPTRYAFVDALPKSAIGKVLRRELVRMEIESKAP